jgi:ubiquinone/menaquinone biosynthesis C-methylase UbiE
VSELISQAIAQRYDALASEPKTNLSCGGAADAIDARAGDVCVDLGCGRGRDVVKLAAKVGATGHVFGLDGALKMVAAATGAAREAGLTNVTILHSPLEALALPDASADWVVSNCALNHATDKTQVWREVARVLKPGGRFVISDIFAVEPIAEQFRTDPVAIAECWAGAESREQCLAHVAAAGLVEVTPSKERAPYRKREALLSSFTLSGRKPPARAEPHVEEVMR